MSETVEQLKAKISEYEKRMGIGDFDPAKEGYFVYVGILNQQIEYLRDFKIKSRISSEEKSEMAEYKNAKDLWENLPDMITKVDTLKVALKMEGEQKKSTFKPISPLTVAEGSNV